MNTPRVMRRLDMGDGPRSGRDVAGDLAKAARILEGCARELDQLLDAQYFEIDRYKDQIRARYAKKLAKIAEARPDLADALLMDVDTP